MPSWPGARLPSPVSEARPGHPDFLLMGSDGTLDGTRQVAGVEAEGAGLALVENASAGRDEEEPVRPACISSFHAIVKAIDQRGKLDARLAHARSGHGLAFRLVARAAE